MVDSLWSQVEYEAKLVPVKAEASATKNTGYAYIKIGRKLFPAYFYTVLYR